MATEDNVDVGFHPNGANRILNCHSGMDGNGILNCPSSGMDTNLISDKVAGVAMCSDSMFKTSSAGVETFYGSGWDPLVSLNHSENYGGSSVVPHNEFANSHYPVVLGNQSVGSSSHLVHYPCDSGLVDMVPKIPSFGSGSFSEIVSSFGLPDCGQVTETGSHLNGASNKGVPYQEDCQNSEGGLGSSSSGKKKRKASDSPSPLLLKKNVEREEQKGLSGNGSECSKEQDEMKQKMEQTNSTNLRSKQTGKQIKDNSNNGEPPKENYIHVRAKRGQATNSHSLAERVRRERISERMRLLQELVPGCNKITGKAVMLDEIINYVQSLQQQVEFLSMKLATVNPELNIDLDQIFSKDILHASRGSNAATLGIGPTLNSSHAFPGFPPGTLPGIPGAATAPFHPLPQALWDSELQNIFPMGFDSNASANNLGPNGRSKLEL